MFNIQNMRKLMEEVAYEAHNYVKIHIYEENDLNSIDFKPYTNVNEHIMALSSKHIYR